MRFCLILITGFVFLSSCSNEIDINADFREIPIVHGLLNVEDSVHYLRIQRAFIDENTSALTLAQDANQIYYGDQLEVYVDEYWNNIHLNRFHASRLLSLIHI